ncbi:hypothetical protein C8J56DRAFT_1024574 [Mycena floridula]|nr:hypothetical protein C8J56DRAFT_1024574 [Mycena floridula]
MPRIRKETSNRKGTNDRKKVQHKIREGRKKNAKAAKKNPQWVSKHKKDPGIPNNFPFKDQLLAEVAEQRRLAAEEKERKKAEKKGGKAVQVPKDGDAQVDPAQLSDGEFDGVESLHTKRLSGSKVTTRPVPVVVPEPEEQVPALIHPDFPHLQTVLDAADVVIQVLDCKDPLAFRSSHLEELVKTKSGTHFLFVLNKIDCVPREAVSAWLSKLRSEHSTFLFRSASAFLPIATPVQGKGKAKLSSRDGLGVDQILECLSGYAAEREGDEPLKVAVVGVTNVGKSSFINSLSRKAALPTYTLSTSSRGPTTTERPQQITVESNGKQICLIDTPGLSWQNDEIYAVRARDILMRNKGRIDRMKDPTPSVEHLVSRSNAEDLMLLYTLPAFTKGDCNAFLSGVSRSQQLTKKRGALDIAGACRIVLRDWSTGKLKWYSMPAAATEGVLSDSDQFILSASPCRKDMRKSGGLVRFASGEIESRAVQVDTPYSTGHESPDEEGGSDDQMDEESQDGDEDPDQDESLEEEDEDEDEELEEEEEIEVPTSSNKKRKRAPQEPLPPVKKVAFASQPKASKAKPSIPKPKKVQKGPKAAPVSSKPDAEAGSGAYDFELRIRHRQLAPYKYLALHGFMRLVPAVLETLLNAMRHNSSSESNCLNNTRPARHFNDLPFELQSEILLYCLSQSPRYPALHDNWNNAPSIFLEVSRTWNNVALSIPRLWSSFELVIGYGSHPSVDANLCAKVKLWLCRSRQVPLSFSFKYEPRSHTGREPLFKSDLANCSEIVRALMTAISRWEHVEFVVPGEIISPLVQSQLYNLGNLRSLAFNLLGTWPLQGPSEISTWGVAWKELTDLHLTFEASSLPTLGECAKILALATNLRTCTLKAKATIAQDDIVPDRITMSRLYQFKLVVDVDGVSSPESSLAAFFQSLEVVNLTELELRWLKSSNPSEQSSWLLCHQAFTSFLAQLDQLHKLDLRGLPLSAPQLTECLKFFPQLTHLFLDFGIRERDDPFTKRFLESLTVGHRGAMVPSLERLEVKCHGKAEGFSGMIQSRLGTLLLLRVVTATGEGIWRAPVNGWPGLDVHFQRVAMY